MKLQEWSAQAIFLDPCVSCCAGSGRMKQPLGEKNVGYLVPDKESKRHLLNEEL
jgi:hypothetical protein